MKYGGCRLVVCTKSRSDQIEICFNGNVLFLLIVTTNGIDQQRGAANFVYVYSDGYETDVIPISVKKSRKQDEMSPANQSQSRLRSNECQTTVGIGSFRIFTKEIIIKSVIGN